MSYYNSPDWDNSTANSEKELFKIVLKTIEQYY